MIDENRGLGETSLTMKTMIPASYQPPLPTEKFILNEKPGGEAVPLDVLFVGGGPAGLAGAIELAKLVKKELAVNPQFPKPEIGILEKAQRLGDHCLSGAVVNPGPLRELFPELKDSHFPFRGAVKSDRVYFMTENHAFRIPTPPTMHNKGNYFASISELTRWMGTKAEELGVNILTGFPAESLLVDDGKVVGVRTAAAGLDREGKPSSRFMPPTDISSRFTVLSEGTRGSLTQAYLKWQGADGKCPQIYALGVKEIWKVKKAHEAVIHTMGWPLPSDAFGGSFFYPMGPEQVALGLVVGLDYKAHSLDTHGLLQKLKNHPLFSEILKEGQILEWGAKTIPEGGFDAIPQKLQGAGAIVVGDGGGFVNVPALKGIHYAIQSGILAARTIFDALKANSSDLQNYQKMVSESFISKDLYKTRNMRHAFKSGFYRGAIKAGLMTLTGGAFPGGRRKAESDAAEPRSLDDQPSLFSGSLSITKVDGVFRSGNTTRDDIPKHLIVGKDIPPELADFYSHVCPAGVYERKGDHLVINAPNCVDCKATDVVGPRWTPREGGSGPKYQEM